MKYVDIIGLFAASLMVGCAASNENSKPAESDHAQVEAAPEKAASKEPAHGAAHAEAKSPHSGGAHASAAPASPADYPPIKIDPREKHLSNIRQLTYGGENAEAYFSFDGKRLSLQAHKLSEGCDQIYTMKTDGSDLQMVSNGEGSTTCSYYTKDGEWVIYASTHLGGPECPPKPDMSHGYTWPLYKSYDIFKRNLKSGEIVRLTDAPGYDAEATISPDGQTIIFTSVRDGDIELYTMDLDGKNQKRITHTPGYDGGAFFSHDGKKIVWRASRPEGEKLKQFKELLDIGLVRPSQLEVLVANVDGTDVKQLTHNGAANFAPFFLPDDSGVLFVSNLASPRGHNFDIYSIKLDGTGLEQITFHESFDGFPMFSPDGKQLAFSSNRNSLQRGETNVFIADWVP